VELGLEVDVSSACSCERLEPTETALLLQLFLLISLLILLTWSGCNGLFSWRACGVEECNWKLECGCVWTSECCTCCTCCCWWYCCCGWCW
jgi:hypothetical protein